MFSLSCLLKSEQTSQDTANKKLEKSGDVQEEEQRQNNMARV